MGIRVLCGPFRLEICKFKYRVILANNETQGYGSYAQVRGSAKVYIYSEKQDGDWSVRYRVLLRP